MSTMKRDRRRPEEGAERATERPERVVDRLPELLPDGALDVAVQGLKPEEALGSGRAAQPARGARRRNRDRRPWRWHSVRRGCL